MKLSTLMDSLPMVNPVQMNVPTAGLVMPGVIRPHPVMGPGPIGTIAVPVPE